MNIIVFIIQVVVYEKYCVYYQINQFMDINVFILSNLQVSNFQNSCSRQTLISQGGN